MPYYVMIHCRNEQHVNDIDILCNEVVDSCIRASRSSIPQASKNGKRTNVPYWFEEVKPLKDNALFWHWLWGECGKRKHDAVYDVMRHTKHQYHYAIRAAKKQETDLRKQRLAESCSSNNTKDMWQELKQMSSSRKLVANVMDDACASSAISEVFAKKYQALYSSVPTSPQEMDTLTEMVNGALTGETSDVVNAVTKLNRGKRDGSDNFYSDHIINALPKLYAMLAMLINCMVAHGYSPHKLLKSTIVPIPKDNRSSMTRSDNYKAIALCNSICKLIDIVFIDKYSDALYTSQLQFGFKKNRSTVLYTSVLLETVSYFTQINSDVYACMLDASKAFDRVHYGKFLKLLLHRKMPAVFN